MKGITFGPAGGRALSRVQRTKVTLAGRTAFLPNDDVRLLYEMKGLPEYLAEV